MLTDPDADYSTITTGLTKGMESAMGMFGKVTGLSYWNNFHKRVGARVSLARTMRSLKQGVTPGSKEATRLARMGISSEHFNTILEQFAKHGEEANGSYILNPHLWDKDASGALKALEGSILKDTDMAGVLTPSRGDIPIIVQKSEIAKMLFQFKTFASAATSKILLKAFDRRDSQALQGITVMVGLGMGVEALKQKMAGKELPEVDTKLVMQGITRSGLLGVMGDYTLGSLNAIYGGVSQRYAGRNLMGLYGGPALGTAETAANLTYLNYFQGMR
jgi:hypothetical protein